MKKKETQKTDAAGEPQEKQLVKPQRLTVGVNFVPQGETEEIRIEAGLIEAGTLPPAFEQTLRERKQLFDV